MNLVERSVRLLDTWTLSRSPSPADLRHMVGSWAAKSLVQYFVVERLVSIAWVHIDSSKNPPDNYIDYDYTQNFISDLGARGCHTIDGGSVHERLVCSPLFAVTDFSFILLGIGVVVAASLITSTVLRVGGQYGDFTKERRKSETGGSENDSNLKLLFRHLNGEHYGRKLIWRHYLTTATRILFGVAGIALIGVGSFPEDYNSTIHRSSTTTFFICAIAALFALMILWFKPRPISAVLILLATLLAAVGGVALKTTEMAHLAPQGLFERFIVYGFIAGMAIMGITLTSGARRRVRARQAARPRGAPTISAPLLDSTRPGVPSNLASSGRPNEPR